MTWNRYAIVLLSAMLLAACHVNPNDAERTEKISPNRQAAEINVQLGLGYLQEGHVSRAKHKLLVALEQDPHSTLAIDAMAYFYEYTGELDKARQYYLRAVRMEPHSGITNNNFGTFLCRQKDFQQADQYFLKAVEDKNYLNVAKAYANAGMCALQAKDLEKGKAYLQKALKRDPQEETAVLALADLALKEGALLKADNIISRYLDSTVNPSARALALGYRIAKQTNNTKKQASYALMLKSQHHNTAEYAMIQKQENN